MADSAAGMNTAARAIHGQRKIIPAPATAIEMAAQLNPNRCRRRIPAGAMVGRAGDRFGHLASKIDISEEGAKRRPRFRLRQSAVRYRTQFVASLPRCRRTIEAVQGDITNQDVDAIVNAANTSLLGGGGVDGAIHRAAGRALLEACRRSAVARPATRASRRVRLVARHVIHTVGPVWGGGGRGEPALLRSCYEQSFALAVEHGLRSIAFPSISTGAYRFPIERAARIAVEAARDHAGSAAPLKLVRFVCFSADDMAVYEALLSDA